MVSDIERVLVVGAGVMGHGIAEAFALSGYRVWLMDSAARALERAKRLIHSSLETLVSEGLLEGADVAGVLDRISYTTELREGARTADFVIECVVEDAAVKKEVLGELHRLCRPEVVLASNTTALNIFALDPAVRPEKLVLCHWYAPPVLVPLVDVVKGPQTSEETVELTAALLRGLGKHVVVMNTFVAGYIVPRLQMALQREVFYLIDQGIPPRDIDEAARAGLALRMLVLGVVQRIDFGGLDLTARLLGNPDLQNQLAPPDYVPRKILELAEEGHLGVKTGRGFFEYPGRSEEEVYRERDRRLIRVLKLFEELSDEGEIGVG